MRNSDVSVEVRIYSKPIREYQDPKTSKHWIEGRDGSAFTIRIRNFRNDRILAVPTVDGLSVLDGQPGDLYTSGGYIVQPHGFVDIPGWRLNNDEVAQFVFGAKRKSYANKSGEGTDNCGLIGVAVFNEKVKSWTCYPQSYTITYPAQPWQWHTTCNGTNSTLLRSNSLRDDTSQMRGISEESLSYGSSHTYTAANCSAPATPTGPVIMSCFTSDVQETPKVEEQHLGTQFGAAMDHAVEETVFEKAYSEPFATFLLYYDSKQGLLERGVLNRSVVCEKPKSPSAFPGSACVPPRGWNG